MFDVSIYNDLLRIARPLTKGRNFDSEDLVHEIYLQEQQYSLDKKNKVLTALRRVAWTENSTSVWFQIRHKIEQREYICKRCKEQKPVAGFRIKKDQHGCIYVENICTECKKKYSKDYYYTNTDKHKAGMARYRKNNEDAIKKLKRAWYQANRDRLIEKAKAYQKARNTEKKTK